MEAVFLALLHHSPEAFPPEVPFRMSLYRVVMGESWRRLRRPRGVVESALRETGVAERIRRVLHRLDPLDRAAFLLRQVEQLSSEEAATVLGIGPSSIRRRTHHATLVLTSAWDGCLMAMDSARPAASRGPADAARSRKRIESQGAESNRDVE